MDADRIEFLFGPGIDPDDDRLTSEDGRAELLEEAGGDDLPEPQFAVQRVIANQILDDEPPEAWTTARRLLDVGLDRDRILRQLALAFMPTVVRAIADEAALDPDEYLAALDELPLPEVAELEAALLEVVRASQGFAISAAVDQACEQLGRASHDDMIRTLVERTMDVLIDHGRLVFVGNDELVDLEHLSAGIVLTHRLSEIEIEIGTLNASFDLAGLSWGDELVLPTGEPVSIFSVEHHHLGWSGPGDWLSGFEPGSLVSCQVSAEGELTVALVDEPIVADEHLVARLREVYDQAVEEPWLPVASNRLLAPLLVADRQAFSQAGVPLVELAAAAGLEVRRDEVAHDESVWRSAHELSRTWRVLEAFGPDEASARQVLHALEVADAVGGADIEFLETVDRPVDDAMTRAVLADLADLAEIGGFVLFAGEVFDGFDEEGQPRGAGFVEAALGAAKRGREIAIARLLAAIHAEHSSDPLVAEQHLELAHQADLQLEIVTDRLAWYASDRGDAARAVRLWNQLQPSASVAQDLREVEPFAASKADPPRRNDPCWCGSGRKYKQCHLGATELAPLPDRVGWLCRKAVAFVERCGPEARQDVFEIAEAVAGGSDEASLAAALGDPFTFDLVLTECGWWEHFVKERGPLLPDDEALLAASWLLVDRTVYEVVAVRPGEGLELRDLRTAEVIEVRERTLSHQATVGLLLCGRAVPDGHTHQLVGGILPVAPGREAALLDVLDEGDPEEIADWIAASRRPPALATREGEPYVECELVLEVDDARAARAFLDATYEPAEDEGASSGNEWVELFPLNEDERVIRARLDLDGTTLAVHANSEERADRVLQALHAGGLSYAVRRDDRTPIDAAAMQARAASGASMLPTQPNAPADVSDPAVAQALSEMRDRIEERWCDEQIPALGGVTPREAAADPTRRESLERLLVSFEAMSVDPTLAMRPDRIRSLLGL